MGWWWWWWLGGDESSPAPGFEIGSQRSWFGKTEGFGDLLIGETEGFGDLSISEARMSVT